MGGMIAQTLAARHPRPGALADLDHVQHRQPPSAGSRRSRVYARCCCAAPPQDREAVRRAHRRACSTSSARPASAATTPTCRDARRATLRPRPRPAGDRRASSRRSSPRATAPRSCGTIRAPTLVIHGSRRPARPPSGGRATARAIPGARLLMIERHGPRPAAPALAGDRQRDRRQRAPLSGSHARAQPSAIQVRAIFIGWRSARPHPYPLRAHRLNVAVVVPRSELDRRRDRQRERPGIHRPVRKSGIGSVRRVAGLRHPGAHVAG